MHYYQRDLALIHDQGYGLHADRCAPGILELLSGVGEGLVLEFGCGSGALTRHLLAAGLRVVATDASPDMLALAREALGPGVDLRLLALPGDPLPAADAIVSVGHAISYLPDAAAVDAALTALAGALRPGGVLALDILDLEYGQARAGEPPIARVEADWAIITDVRHAGPGPVRPRHHHVRPRRRRGVAPRRRAPRERARGHVPHPGAAGRARRAGFGRHRVRGRGAPGRPAFGDRAQDSVTGSKD